MKLYTLLHSRICYWDHDDNISEILATNTEIDPLHKNISGYLEILRKESYINDRLQLEEKNQKQLN